MVYVPAARLKAGFRVSRLVPEREIDVGEKEAVRPEGSPVTVKVTVPVKPFKADTVAVSLSAERKKKLRGMVTLAALNEKVKLAAAPTVKLCETGVAAE
jgi:hypothetical protein